MVSYAIHITTDHMRKSTQIRGTTFLAWWHTVRPTLPLCWYDIT